MDWKGKCCWNRFPADRGLGFRKFHTQFAWPFPPLSYSLLMEKLFSAFDQKTGSTGTAGIPKMGDEIVRQIRLDPKLWEYISAHLASSSVCSLSYLYLIDYLVFQYTSQSAISSLILKVFTKAKLGEVIRNTKFEQENLITKVNKLALRWDTQYPQTVSNPLLTIPMDVLEDKLKGNFFILFLEFYFHFIFFSNILPFLFSFFVLFFLFASLFSYSR